MNKNGKKILIIILSIIVALLILFTLIFMLNNKKENKNEKDNEVNDVVSIEDQLWYDFNNKIINTDEYVKYNIYNNYDRSLLPEKYLSASVIGVDNLITKYYDELSEETIKLYLNYYSLSNISFKIKTSSSQAKPLANTIENGTTTNLNKAYLSSKGNFLFWYTTEGSDAVTDSDVEKYGELLENIIIKYEKTINLKYFFKSKIFSTLSQRYNDQVEILKAYNIEEKYMSDAMHVYIYDLKNDQLHGIYHSMNISDDIFSNIIDEFLYESTDGTIITPYISLNAKAVNILSENTLAHELFHHYQNYIINNETGTRNDISDTIIGEASADWAAAKISENTLKNNGLNIWVSNYFKHTGDMFTTMYDTVGSQVGYAMFKFLYSYEKNVQNGVEKIFNSIHSENGFEYLNDNATNDERIKVMADLALKNLNNDYPNNNYLPKDNETVKLEKEIVDNEKFSKNTILSSTGINYYLFNSNLKHNYKVKINTNSEYLNVYVITFANGKYETLLTNTSINNTQIDLENYKNYDKLYVIITNSNFVNNYSYDINIEESTIKNQTTFNTKFDNYKIKATSKVVMYGMESISYINGVVDELHQKEHLEVNTQVMGINVTTSSYVDFAKGYTYTKNPLYDTWEKSNEATSLIDLTIILNKFKENGSVTKVNSEKYLVKLTKDDIKGLLKYNNTLSQYNLDGDIFVTVYIKDNYVYKLEYDFSQLMDEIDKFSMTIEFYDHNKAGEVTIPVEATK